MKHLTVIALLAATVALLTPAAASAAAQLDQSQPTVAAGGGFYASDRNRSAQSFTSGLTGRLTQVDVAVEKYTPSVAAPLALEIRGVTSGHPNSTVLGSGSIPAAMVPPYVPGGAPAFVSVPLTAPAAVQAGKAYTIHLSSADCPPYPGCYVVGIGPFGDPYPGGLGSYSSDNGVTWDTSPSYILSDDIAFKTYVDAVVTGCVVPLLTGLRVAAAIRAIYAARCTLGTLRWRHSLRPFGRVIAQLPSRGTLLDDQARVRIVISRGRRM